MQTPWWVWNGSPLTTSFVSSNQLTVTISSTQIAQPDTALVYVYNPTGGIQTVGTGSSHGGRTQARAVPRAPMRYRSPSARNLESQKPHFSQKTRETGHRAADPSRERRGSVYSTVNREFHLSQSQGEALYCEATTDNASSPCTFAPIVALAVEGNLSARVPKTEDPVRRAYE